MSVGGPIEEITIAGRSFAVAGDVDASRMLGGKTNEVASNGNGTARKIESINPWSLNGLNLSIDDMAGDQEFLQDVADRKDFVPMSVTMASGAVYQGRGQITGEISFSNQNTTASVGLSGPQKLERQI